MEQELKKFDMCRGSILHKLFTRSVKASPGARGIKKIPTIAAISIFIILPFVFDVFFLPEIWVTSPELRVPFLRDWNVLFMFLCTLPLVFFLLLTERQYIPDKILDVYKHNVLKFNQDEEPKIFFKNWQKKYLYINMISQLVGLFATVFIIYSNYLVITGPDFKGWQSTDHAFNAAGLIFLFWQMPFFWFVIIIYFIRAVATVFFLRHLARVSNFNLMALHPDNAAGLGPIGRIGLRNQYVLAAGGINAVLMFVVVQNLNQDPVMTKLFAAAVIFYIVAGPIIFVGPLMPFRQSMKEEKEENLRHIAEALRRKYTNVIESLKEDRLSKDDDEEIKRIKELRLLIEKIPVWPFDTETLRRFLTVYLSPIAATLILPFVKEIITALSQYLPRYLGLK